jgi:predicted methyltransferase
MKRTALVAVATWIAALAFPGSAVLAAGAVPAAIAAAVADPARPKEDRDRDADRKPAECVAYSGIRKGDRVADLIPGTGYFTRIFSAVVGKEGRVYAVAPPRRPGAPADAPEPAAPVQAIAADPHYANVTVSVERVTELKFPEPLDMIWTSQNYHDIHNIPNVDVGDFNKAVFEALKPGGIFIVLDHAAEPGSGFRDTSTLHRIDARAVRNEVLAAGFEFIGESKAVFDPSIRGHTDRFILKFRKPNKKSG